jgi:hypothetical protein
MMSTNFVFFGLVYFSLFDFFEKTLGAHKWRSPTLSFEHATTLADPPPKPKETPI